METIDIITPLQNNSNFSIHPSNVDKLFTLNSLYCVSMVTVTELAKTTSNSGKRSEMVETNNLDWKANAKHVIAEICIIHKDLTFWTTQKLVDCSLMLYLFQTGWSTCWTRWIERKNSSLKSVRLHTWINMPHAHWGGLVTTLGHMSWTSQSASHKTLAPIQRLFDSTIGCYLFCGDAIGPFWRFSKLLLSCFFFSGVTNCVHVRMGLQTLRWIS